jgi:hypothetical protein
MEVSRKGKSSSAPAAMSQEMITAQTLSTNLSSDTYDAFENSTNGKPDAGKVKGSTCRGRELLEPESKGKCPGTLIVFVSLIPFTVYLCNISFISKSCHFVSSPHHTIQSRPSTQIRTGHIGSIPYKLKLAYG